MKVSSSSSGIVELYLPLLSLLTWLVCSGWTKELTQGLS